MLVSDVVRECVRDIRTWVDRLVHRGQPEAEVLGVFITSLEAEIRALQSRRNALAPKVEAVASEDADLEPTQIYPFFGLDQIELSDIVTLTDIGLSTSEAISHLLNSGEPGFFTSDADDAGDIVSDLSDMDFSD